MAPARKQAAEAPQAQEHPCCGSSLPTRAGGPGPARHPVGCAAPASRRQLSTPGVTHGPLGQPATPLRTRTEAWQERGGRRREKAARGNQPKPSAAGLRPSHLPGRAGAVSCRGARAARPPFGLRSPRPGSVLPGSTRRREGGMDGRTDGSGSAARGQGLGERLRLLLQRAAARWEGEQRELSLPAPKVCLRV